MKIQWMVDAVKVHAHKNYERSGWDVVVECWSDAEIAEQIKNCKSDAGAIRKMAKEIAPHAAYRDEIRAEIF